MDIYFDGASKGNPGDAGCGWRIVSGDGSESSGGRSLGQATSNVAEYQGLISALREARPSPGETVNVRGDSKLVIEQVQGNWRVNAPHLQPLAREARELVSEYRSNGCEVNFEHIPRSENSYADSMASRAASRSRSSRSSRGRGYYE